MTAPSDICKVKYPSISVIVPFVVPNSIMLAPIRGSLLVSMTLPVIVLFICLTISARVETGISRVV